MLGTLDSTRPRARVVGGGIAGLLIAYTLAKRGWAIELHESSNRWGGLIQTVSAPYGIYETAAHSLLATEEVESLFQELDLKLISLKNRQRYILRDARLKRMPLSFLELIELVFRFFFVRVPKQGSVEAWLQKRLGEPALQYLVNPFLRGIYAARPSELSTLALFPDRLKKKRKHRPKMKAPEKGMQSLVDALVLALKNQANTTLHLNSKLLALTPYDGNTVVTTPATIAAKLIRDEYPELSQRLEKVQYAPLVTATVFYRVEEVPKSIRGVGVLIPEIESDYRVLGILFNSSSFNGRARDENWVSFTVMLGGTSHREHSDLDEEALRQIIDEDLKKILQIGVSPASLMLTRWKNAIPLYNDDLLETWKVAQNSFREKSGLVLFGNYTGQVSIRGMIESMDYLDATLSFDKIK